MLNSLVGKVFADGAIIETDEQGPRLANILRRGVIASMAGLAAVTAVAPSMAATFHPPSQGIAAAYLADANDAAARTIATWNNGRLAKVTVANANYQEANYSTKRTKEGVFWANTTCEIHHAAPTTLQNMYGGFLDLPEDINLSSVEIARGAMDCIARTFMDSSDVDRYERSALRMASVVDALMVIASVRHGPEAYKAISSFEAASALAMFKSPNREAHAFALTKKQGIGTLDGYLKSRPNAVERIKNASLPDLVKMADALVRSSKTALGSISADMDDLRSPAVKDIHEKLASAGLAGAATAAKMAASTGLVREHGYFTATKRNDGCENITDWRYRKEQNRKAFCRMVSQIADSMSDITIEYGASLESHLDTILHPAKAP